MDFTGIVPQERGKYIDHQFLKPSAVIFELYAVILTEDLCMGRKIVFKFPFIKFKSSLAPECAWIYVGIL